MAVVAMHDDLTWGKKSTAKKNYVGACFLAAFYFNQSNDVLQ